MAALHIHLLGKVRVQRDGRQLEGFDPRKVQELLCYLAIHRGRPQARETLADVLWGDMAGGQAKKCLRQSLWQLQTALTSSPIAEPLLSVEADWIQLNPLANYWLDIVVLEGAFLQVRDLGAGELSPALAADVCRAVDLYQGDLLEGSYQDWCLFERERLQSTYLALLDRLMDHFEARHEYASGLACGEQILRHDHAREGTHRRVMRLCYLSGDRSAAVRQYHRCVRALETELGVGPAQRTVALYQQICADSLTGDGLALDAPPPKAVDLAGSLRALQHMLDGLQRQIQQSLDALGEEPGDAKTLTRHGRDNA